MNTVGKLVLCKFGSSFNTMNSKSGRKKSDSKFSFVMQNEVDAQDGKCATGYDVIGTMEGNAYKAKLVCR